MSNEITWSLCRAAPSQIVRPEHSERSSNLHRPIALSLLVLIVLMVGTSSVMIYSLAEETLSVAIAYSLLGIFGSILTFTIGKDAGFLYCLGYGTASLFSVILHAVYMNRYGMPFFLGGSDDFIYEISGSMILNDGIIYDRDLFASRIGEPWHNSIGYVYLVSLFFRFGEVFGGYDTLIPRIFNASLLGLCAVVVFSIAKKISLTRRQSFIAGLWIIFFPMMLFSTAHVFRDNVTCLLLLLGLYFSLRINLDERSVFKGYLIFYAILFIIIIAITSQFRLLYVIPLLTMLFVALVVRIFSINHFRVRHVLVGSLVFFLMYIPLASSELFLFGLRAINSYNIRQSAGEQSAVDGLSLVLFNLPEPLQTVARFGYSIITPLPILYERFEWNFLSLGTLVQFLFSAYAFIGLLSVCRNPKLSPLVVGFVMLFSSYALGTLTFRHITQWFPFAVLIGSFGYWSFSGRRTFITKMSVLAIVPFYFSYALLKI